ncbi:MAG: threonine ammonia-lyase [Nitrosopumilus sp.]|nr:threonine ammonia-lyase [Nitrosopumilus sp.]CAI9831288.1 L-threonine ammonia-lyase [Nitrosopumilaceae archaeon]MDA7942114.1 threonine ammonia-lyase [Nitrosopumilus sp.]MDA7943619.1 threonine ammonia-lyase [Nitrosopumilus sp.]MDA7944334.1 threonine ammonia-lyase [Nitrosopumilus sp.]
MGPTYEDVRRAAESVGGGIKRTPLISSPAFSKMTGSEVHLKAEFMQKTGSFKIRGAYHKIRSMPESERARGVVAASAGNHAQGVAYASSLEGIRCTIVMPRNASPAKVAATRGYGAEVVLTGTSYDEAHTEAAAISERTGAVMIHAFDDPHVIAAQGVVGLEILEDLPDVEEIYMPVGGGGLAAGILLAVKGSRPDVRVVGVQSRSHASMHDSVREGRLVSTEGGRTIADGIAVRRPGSMTFEIVSRLIDEVVLVDDSEITEAMFLLMERTKFVVEPAGAASLAYLISRRPSPGKKVAAVLAGGNIDMYLLGQIVDKGLAATGRLLKVSVLLPDRPGAFKEIVDEVTSGGANIVEVIHDRLSSGISAGSAGVTLNLETQGREQSERLIASLRSKGVSFRLLS